MNKKCPYINRDDVAQMLIEGVLENNSSPQYAEYIRMLVYSVPSADVAPVRHGRWVEKGTITDEKAEVITEWQSARCTCCNKYHTTPYLYYFDNFAYCPNCGAKMDEEENDE